MSALQIWLQNHNRKLTQDAIDEALMEYISMIETQRDELLSAMRRAVVAGAHHSIEAKKDCYNIIDATIRECVKSMEEV